MVSDDPESFADLDGHDGVWDTILRLAGGSLSNPGPAMKNLIIGGAKGLLNLPVSFGNALRNQIGALDGGGVSQTPELPLNNEGEAIGAQASTTLLFSVIGGAMGEGAGPDAADVGAFARQAADEAQAGGRTSGTAAALRTSDGTTYTGESGGGGTNHPDVQQALDNVPAEQRSPYHGCCAEIKNLNQAKNVGKDVRGATAAAAKNSQTG